jgi:hypothetical protein
VGPDSDPGLNKLPSKTLIHNILRLIFYLNFDEEGTKSSVAAVYKIEHMLSLYLEYEIMIT